MMIEKQNEKEGLEGLIEKAKSFYFFGFFEGETGEQGMLTSLLENLKLELLTNSSLPDYFMHYAILLFGIIATFIWTFHLNLSAAFFIIAPWILRPSITFPIAFAVVGLGFWVTYAVGGISERGAQVTDELDDIILSWNVLKDTLGVVALALVQK